MKDLVRLQSKDFILEIQCEIDSKSKLDDRRQMLEDMINQALDGLGLNLGATLWEPS